MSFTIISNPFFYKKVLVRLQGAFGTALKIKPLLSFDKDGKVVTLEKIRTTRKAHRRVLQKYFEDTKDKNVLTFILIEIE